MGADKNSARGFDLHAVLVERREEIGMVQEVTGRARNRLYRANEILHAFKVP